MDWILENGRPVTSEDLQEEITRVPRTSYWRLSHIVLLWPAAADPAGEADIDGFRDGFAIELVAVAGAVDWLLQPLSDATDKRLSGRAPSGREAVAAVFSVVEDLATRREAERHERANRRTADRQAGSIT